MEYLQKIVYLLLFFLPLILFFALGLWIAWWLWYRSYAPQLRLAYDRHLALGRDLITNRERAQGLSNRLLQLTGKQRTHWLELVSSRDSELKGFKTRFAEVEGERDQLITDLRSKKAAVNELDLRFQNLAEEKDVEVNGLLAKIGGFEGDLGTKSKELESVRGDLKLKVSRVGELEGQVKKLAGDVSARQCQLDELKESTVAKDAQIVDMEEALSGLRTDLRDRDARVVELEEEIGLARGELDSKVGLLGELQGQLDGLQQDVAGKDESLGLLSLQLNTKAGEADGVERDLRGKVASLKGDLEGRDERIGALESEVGELRESLTAKSGLASDLESQVVELDLHLKTARGVETDLRGQVTGLKGDLEGRDARIGALESEVDELQGAVVAKTGVASDLENQIAALKGDLESRDRRLGDLEAERDLIKEDLDGKRDRLSALEGDLSDKNTEIASALANLESMQLEMTGKDERLGLLNVQVEEFGAKEAELENLRQRSATLEADVRAAGEEVERLTAGLEAREAALSESKAKIDALEQAIGTKEVALSELNGEAEALRGQLVDTKADLDTRREEISALEEELADTTEVDALKGSLGSLQDELAVEREKAGAQASGLAFFAGEQVNDDDSFGFVYGNRPNQVDDLKAISGVAEKTEIELNNAGVYRYKQIALWSQAQLDAFSERLDFKGRVEREQWVNQAADLHCAQTGERLTPRVDIYHKPIVRTVTKEVDPEALLAAFGGESVRHDQELGVLYESRPEVVDDLKEISGVAKVLEGKLHDHGVYQYKQVALWTEENVSEFSDRLNFPDRIWRDQWVNQAVDLHYAKHGEHLTPYVPIYRKPETRTRTIEVDKVVEDKRAVEAVTVATSAPSSGLFTGADDDDDSEVASGDASEGNGRRVVFVMDVSRSLTEAQMKLSKDELRNAIEGLPDGARYQVVFFSGAVWFAHQRMVAGGERGQDVVIRDGAREFRWASKFRGFEYEEGNESLPTGEWRHATPEAVAATLRDIDDVTTSFGTTWHLPLTAALNLEPAPKNIYFLTDGSTARQEEVADEMAALAEKCGGAKINTIALMVPEAAKPLNRLARKTGGRFSMVVAGGKVLEGEKLKDYLTEKDITLD